MTVFLAVAREEIRTAMRRVSTWMYFLVYAGLAMLLVLATGGAWDEVSVAFGAGGRVDANSPYAFAALFPVLSLLGISITAALAGQALYRDIDARFDPLLYTTPVAKGTFLAGRFAGTLVVNTLVVSGIGIGALLATISPWVQPEHMGPIRAVAFVQPYLTHVLPNVVLTVALFFALVAITREILPNYVGGALLLIGYLMAGQVLGEIDDKFLAGLIDPFGNRALTVLTEYWPIAEKNTRVVPFAGVVAWNRVLWGSISLAILALAYRRFEFAHPDESGVAKAVAAPPPDPAALLAEAPVRLDALPAVASRAGVGATLVQFRTIALRSLMRIVRNRYFGVIIFGGLLYLLVVARAAGQLFGTPTWPVTYQMVDIIDGTFGLFILVVVAFYAGELVWSERDAKLSQIVDATPVGSTVTLLAKLAALVGVTAVLLLVAMGAGIAIQLSRGYFRLEPALYLQALFGFRFPDLVLLAVLAMAVQVLVHNKYVGHLVVVLLVVGNGVLSSFGFEHNLYQFGSDAGNSYSDMNGWGPYVGPFVLWKLYWSAFAVLLLVMARVFWVRGEETGAAARLRIARDRFRGGPRLATIGGGAAFAMLGGFLFYNTNILNTYRKSGENRRLQAEAERRYKRYEHMAQPRVIAVRMSVDLFPAERAVVARGEFVLRNRDSVPVDTILVNLGEEMRIRSLAFDGGDTALVSDPAHNMFIYRLARPLPPGDSLTMRFEVEHRERGFPNRIANTFIVGNGSFLGNRLFLPTIGYNPDQELSDEDDRRKEKLPRRAGMRPPTDPRARLRNYVSHDADWVRYEATVSTSADQLALTSGTLQRSWTEGGRRYFHYVMDAPILNLWAFQSARYSVHRDRWRDVVLEIFHHPTHDFNVRRMADAMKAALEYCSTQFGPFQHRELRIVEFPRYARFAQSLPTIIPYSEALGFIARLEKPTDVDYPFYVTAHEVAHQWWAHQAIGASAQGATMLSETLAQYSALMVMERSFGRTAMRRFLEYELDSYLTGRSGERRRELPLAFVENQPYIHYNKGGLAMYALRDHIGEDRVNAALRSFLDRNRFRGPPYPTSLDLVEDLRAATPDSLRYLITDLFETITLYELRTDSARVNGDSASGYTVDLFVNAKKLRADSLGTEREVAFADWIDVGVFGTPARGTVAPDRDGVPLHLTKHRITAGPQRITVTVPTAPSRAGIDPLHKLIDRLTRDNTVNVSRVAAPSPVAPDTPDTPPARPDSSR